ncbi:hypothetical protein D1007_53852 [Hordeum vulgare]|nr:hypothetical protein D1007_53852 [Hordeum vulgare]
MFRFATRPVAAVLYFSVADETFSWVRPPPFDWEKGAHLTELDGRLCIVREDLPRVSVIIWLEILKLEGQIIMVAGCWSFASTGYGLFVKQDICILCCVMKIDPEKSLFSHRHKSILFTKDMVRKNFNVTSGSRAVELLRRNEPHVLREPYRVGSRAPTRRTVEVLEVADVLDVVTIKRAWVLLCIALVLSPGTRNMVPLEYLASLVDMDSINEFAWDEHFLVVALNEVKKYQKKRNEGKTAFWIGGCLPISAIPRHMIPTYEKHKKLHATEVKKVLKSFGQVLEAMFCKRLASILVEANATATSSNHHTLEDVTFHAPADNAADAGHTRAPIHTSPEAHKSPAPQEVDADKEVAETEDVQQGPVLGKREKSVGAEVGGGGDLKDPDVADEGQNVILSQGTIAALQGLALEFDDGPSMSMFKEGTEDFEWLNMDDNTARKYKEENNGI